MIAVDSSSLIAYFAGEQAADTDNVDEAFRSSSAVLPPAVLTEMLSDPDLPPALEADLRRIPVLDIGEGFWERVGRLRRTALKKGLRAKLADALIAQTCLDHNVPLITRDKDFRGLQTVAPLKLV